MFGFFFKCAVVVIVLLVVAGEGLGQLKDMMKEQTAKIDRPAAQTQGSPAAAAINCQGFQSDVNTRAVCAKRRAARSRMRTAAALAAHTPQAPASSAPSTGELALRQRTQRLITMSCAPGTKARVQRAGWIVICIDPRMRGYDRNEFGGRWADFDMDCQNTRHEVLIRQAQSYTLDSDGCQVASGEWLDPYSGKRFTDPGKMDVDHVFALSEAWLQGAGGWTRERRVSFANDPLNLIAADASLNRSKGAQPLGQWQPPVGRAAYEARYRRVAAKYHLRVR